MSDDDKKHLHVNTDAKPEGSRVQEFTRIDREQAPASSDPKVMAMAKSRPAPPRDMSEAKHKPDDGDS